MLAEGEPYESRTPLARPDRRRSTRLARYCQSHQRASRCRPTGAGPAGGPRRSALHAGGARRGVSEWGQCQLVGGALQPARTSQPAYRARRGRKAQYTAAQRARILHELQRVPNRQADGTATWSLTTLERALRKAALPQVSASTIRVVLQEAGYRFGKTRTWCPTGMAVRVRHGETVTVHDPKTEEKNA
jgi:hypothetical protein